MHGQNTLLAPLEYQLPDRNLPVYRIKGREKSRRRP